ncbi:MAG: leucyl/phenylalanyl-tRNA--protein transferase [Terrimicrobiaceae bacterium]
MATLIPTFDLLGLYASGWFPMADGSGRILLYSPDPRGVLPLEAFRIPHGTKQCLNDPAWEIRVDTVFDEVLQGCAARKETWIDHSIATSYFALHRAGHAHSVEVWRGGTLAGGLYGVRLGAAFFGESMFHRYSGASKVALVALVAILLSNGFSLLDTQWVTPHLAGFGATAIPRAAYLGQLAAAIRKTAKWPSPGTITPSDQQAIRKFARSIRPAR